MSRLEHGGDIYSHLVKNIIDFSANINPLGMPDSVKKAIVDNIDVYSNYPDPLCRELVTAISKHENVNESTIVCGNGAADIIFRLCLALKPKQGLIVAPTFSEYETALKQVGCKICHYLLLEKNGFAVDEGILNSINTELEIMFICNPNNPTGIPIKNELIIKIAERCKETNTILVIDECFNDFLENADDYSIVPCIGKFKNVIVLKAFTKIYAMAGIRLGYCICGCTKIADKILNTLQPWSVSTIAAKCGVAALMETEYVIQTKEIVKNNRLIMMAQLENLGFTVFNGAANYIFLKSKDTTLYEKLKEYNILIRSCSNYCGLNENYYRAAIKSQKDNVYLIDCLTKIMG